MMKMAETFSRFDAAHYLTTEKDIAEYLVAAGEYGPDAVVAALATIARARNMAQLAREAGVTREGLYKVLAPAGNPGFATVTRVANALGYGLSFKKLAVGAGARHREPTGRFSGMFADRDIKASEGVQTMTTGKKAASAASKVMRDPKATKGEKKAAASDLSQAKKGGKKK